jgi:hypothetical protein
VEKRKGKDMSRNYAERLRQVNAKDIRKRSMGIIRHGEPTVAPAHWKHQNGVAVAPSTPLPVTISGKRKTLGDLFDRALDRWDETRRGRVELDA